MNSSPVLVLDIDGVVSLAHPGSAHPWHATLKADMGIDYEDLVRGFFRAEFMEVLRGRLDLFVALQDYLEPRGLIDRLEEFVAYWFDKDCTLIAACWPRPMPGASVPAAGVYAATNQEHHRVAYLREHAGLDAHFDEVIYSAALGVCKPERVFYTNAQARMGVTVAQSILFVDDAAANVDGARMAGWRAMLYRGPESLEKALAGWG